MIYDIIGLQKHLGNKSTETLYVLKVFFSKFVRCSNISHSYLLQKPWNIQRKLAQSIFGWKVFKFVQIKSYQGEM